MSTLLQSKLSTVKRRHAAVSAFTGLSLAAGACILIFTTEMLLDWWLELPYVARATALLAQLSLVAYLAFRYIIRPFVFGPDDETAALWVEKWRPDFRNRLIASVQLSRPEALTAATSPAMVHAMVAETEDLSRDLEFSRVIRTDDLLKWFSFSGTLVVLALLALMLTREVVSPLLLRALLVPGVDVPRKTRVEVLTGHITIAHGESLSITARAHGIVPDTGWLSVAYASGQSQRFPMHPNPHEPALFTQTFENVQESFTYTALLNDGRSAEFNVKVSTRPAVASVKCEQVYPTYTKLGTVPRAPGDLVLLAGSRLDLKIKSTKPVRISSAGIREGNHIHLLKADGSAEQLPLTVDPVDPVDPTSLLTPAGIAIAEGIKGFSINLVDDDNLRSKDPVVYRIDVVPDRAPTVRITYPDRREEMVTPQATIIVGFDAVDDFALGKLSLKYKIRLPEVEDSEEIGSGDGLIATYYPTKDFTGEPVTRHERQLNLEWKNGSPAPSIPADYFSSRFVGLIEAPQTGRYTFEYNADEPGGFWLNGQLLIPAGQRRAEVNLKAGEKYPFRAEQVETTGDASVRLYWSFPGTNEQIVPGSRIYTPPESEIAPIPVGDGAGLSAEYFKTADLTGEPLRRPEKSLDFDWGYESPDTSIPKDYFSARWTGQVLPRFSGEYVFIASVDDGVRVWVDDELIIDQWSPQSQDFTGRIDLTAGRKYNLRVEYFEAGAGARLRLLWESADQPREVIPQSQLFPDLAPRDSSNHGLNATYFSNDQLSGKSVQRIDKTLRFDWQASPVEDIPENNFSVRWTGFIQPEFTETYTISTYFDDGARIWINDKLLIDKWSQNGEYRETATIDLEAGKLYSIKVEMREVGAVARMHLWWESDRRPRQYIPKSRFYRTAEGAIDPLPISAPPTEPEDRTPVHTVSLDLQDSPKSLRGQYRWAISSIKSPLPIGTVLEWWLEAEDTNDATGPGKFASDHYQARIVTVEQKREELQRLTNDAFGGLDDLNNDQQELNRDLGVMITEQAKPK